MDKKKIDNSEQGASTSSSIMYLFLLAFAAITLLAACSLSDNDNSHVHNVGSETWETTASADQLPQFLDNHTELTTELYGHVMDHTHTLSELPCYCGCMMGTEIDEAHDSLLRCYMIEELDDGSVTWTDHSTTCGICKQELQTVVEMSDRGSTLDEIKHTIDNQFKPIQ